MTGFAKAFAQVEVGRQQSKALTTQAQQQDSLAEQQLAQNRQEQLRGQEAANQVRETLLRTLATQRAAYAAAGVALDSGTPDTVATETRRQTDRELAIQAGNTAATVNLGKAKADSFRQNAGLLRTQATDARRMGGLNAAISLFESVESAAARVAGAPK